jgi:hypothetical protein
MIGAAMMLIASFLPLFESTGVFRMVQENTLIQHGGWLLIAAAIGIAAGGFAARNGNGWQAVLGTAAISAGGLALFVIDKGNHTLYPVGADGTVDASATGTVVDFGVAVYVAFAGTALAAVGSLMLRNTEVDAASKKKCPECAELVQRDALVCKHCSNRFPPPAPPAPPPAMAATTQLPVASARKVRCHACSSIQQFPSDKKTIACGNCGARMKIATKTP